MECNLRKGNFLLKSSDSNTNQSSLIMNQTCHKIAHYIYIVPLWWQILHTSYCLMQLSRQSSVLKIYCFSKLHMEESQKFLTLWFSTHTEKIILHLNILPQLKILQEICTSLIHNFWPLQIVLRILMFIIAIIIIVLLSIPVQQHSRK